MSRPVTLTAEQLLLVEHASKGGPALVVAVAGAGKTESIVAAVRTMVVKGALPHDILVSTFSKLGAQDMQRRAVLRGIPHGVSWRTLHSCGWSVIGQVSNLGSESPRRRDPVLVDPRGTEGWWVRKLLREYLETRAAGLPEKEAAAVMKMGGAIFTEISLASANLIWPDEWTAADGEVFPTYREWAVTREREPADGQVAELTAGFYRLWEDVKAAPEQRRFDPPKDRYHPRPLHPLMPRTTRKHRRLVRWYSFDDQAAWPARWILEGHRFTEQFAHVFRWVVVDESQDNNRAQTTLAEHISTDVTGDGLNLIFVGDDQQSIYAFRGSQPVLLRLFRDKHFIKQIEFTANFRCAQGILDCANGLLDYAQDRLYPGKLRLGRTDALATKATVTATEYDNVAHEATCVLDSIQEAIEHGVSPDDIAVLYRLNSQSGPFELEAAKRGLLYRVAGGQFFRRREVKAVLSFLAVALDEDDADAWSRVARSIVRGLGPGFLGSYETLAKARSVASKRGLLSGWKKALKTLLPIIDKTKSLLSGDEDPLYSAIRYLADDAGIRAYYRDDSANEEDETDVDVALNGLAECAETFEDASALLHYASESITVGTSNSNQRAKPRVTFSTVHKAKGLEWFYVSAPGWTKDVFPFFRSPIEEERRLGYVCLTRAKQHLHVSWTAVDSRGEAAGPSEMVAESNVVEIASKCGSVHWPAPSAAPATVVGDEDEEGHPEPTWGNAIGG